MKVLVFGAGGIIGQHLGLIVPDGIEAHFYRRKPGRFFRGLDLCDFDSTLEHLETEKPDIIVNLVGESRPDIVEANPGRYERVNEEVPRFLAQWCQDNGSKYVHISSQAIFSGKEPPYGPDSVLNPANLYGCQKMQAEHAVRQLKNTVIVRPTFVIGVRPFPHIGRPNPAEQMLSGEQSKQVNDRWFSPLFARDAALGIWAVVLNCEPGTIRHLGYPETFHRHDIAYQLGVKSEPVSSGSFPGIAPRPIDTTYDKSSYHSTQWDQGLNQLKADWQGKQTLDVAERAREIALFLRIREDQAFERLSKGFGHEHELVAEDFRRSNLQTDDELLAWYGQTEAYIWELSAYHCESGFNYEGMCEGIRNRLAAAEVKRVLCLGDGIGDLTLSLWQAGFDAVYHDLAGSRTAEFAQFRFWLRTGQEMKTALNPGWQPQINKVAPYDAVVSCDFMEHVIDVPAWAEAIKQVLVPGGLFFAQNAFACGSGPQGAIPMHLQRNDCYETDWNPLLASLGFTQESGNWYRSETP